MQTQLSNRLPEADSEQYNDVELTYEECQEALRLMRREKYFVQERAKYVEKMNQDIHPKIFTADEMISAYETHFIIDDENREVVQKIAYYFSGDARFPGDLKKGIWLFGNVGVGKTSMMQFFTNNQRRNYNKVSCRHVEVQYAEKGDPGIRKFSYPEGDVTKRPGVCFDDLGTEPVVTKYYGTDKAVMTEVILNRYDNGFEFNETHVTTNLKRDDIAKRYGTRVLDRIGEMFNVIDFNSNKSRRK